MDNLEGYSYMSIRFHGGPQTLKKLLRVYQMHYGYRTIEQAATAVRADLRTAVYGEKEGNDGT